MLLAIVASAPYVLGINWVAAAFKLSVCGPPLPGGRLSQSQPEWMDPSPQVLGIRHVTPGLSVSKASIFKDGACAKSNFRDGQEHLTCGQQLLRQPPTPVAYTEAY